MGHPERERGSAMEDEPAWRGPELPKQALLMMGESFQERVKQEVPPYLPVLRSVAGFALRGRISGTARLEHPWRAARSPDHVARWSWSESDNTGE